MILAQWLRLEPILFNLFFQRRIFLLKIMGKRFFAGLEKGVFRPAEFPVLRAVSWTLWAAAGASFLYAGHGFLTGGSQAWDSRIDALVREGNDEVRIEKDHHADKRQDVINVKLLARRNPFRPFIEPEVVTPAMAPPPALPSPVRVPLKDMAARLRLMGILAAQPLQAVVEDSTDRRTYYLSEGESIHEFQVERVLEGKIILKFEDERMELVL